MFLLVILFWFDYSLQWFILNRQAERKKGAIIHDSKSKVSIRKKKKINQTGLMKGLSDLNVFYEQTAAISERLENVSPRIANN